jgi:hypothetical protein
VRYVKYELNYRQIAENLVGQYVYRKTRYLLLNKNDKWAIVAIDKKRSEKPFFHLITAVKLLARPSQVSHVKKPDIDVMNKSKMTGIYQKQKSKYLIVCGKYEHMSFITGETLVHVRVIDLIPPTPPHLYDLAQDAIDCGLVDAPIILHRAFIDLERLAKKVSSKYLMLPCSCGSIKRKGTLFLNRCPKLNLKNNKDLTLIGCNRSVKIFRSVYGFIPKTVTICPLELLKNEKSNIPTLTRCCEMKKKLSIIGNLVIVPWDSKLVYVARALNAIGYYD